MKGLHVLLQTVQIEETRPKNPTLQNTAVSVSEIMEHLQTGCNGIKASILSGYESWHTRVWVPRVNCGSHDSTEWDSGACVHMETYHALCTIWLFTIAMENHHF